MIGVLKFAHKYRMDAIVDVCVSRMDLFSNGSLSSDDRKKFLTAASEHGLLRLQVGTL